MEQSEAAFGVACEAVPLWCCRRKCKCEQWQLFRFFQNIRGLRTKCVEIFNNVCSFEFKNACLKETCPN
jgi:hypothetical protein